LGAFVCAEKEYSYHMFYMCYICDVCPKVMFSFHARQSNIVIFIVIVISSRVASRDLAFARSIDAAMLFSSRAAALGASAPRARERRLDSRRGRLDRNRRPSRVLARRPASSRAADPSEDDVDPLGARGERVAVVGVGTRGCALADALAEARALPNAEYWALNADVVTLERSRAGNRWRLPPNNVEVSEGAIEGNAASAASAVLRPEGRLAPRTILVLCAGGEALNSGVAFLRSLAREKNAQGKKRRFFGFKGATRAPEGATMIAGVISPFTFEGRRKQSTCEEYLREASAAGVCDAVITVSQSELLKNGEEGMSVQEATSIADASLLVGVLNTAEALRASCWNSNVTGTAGDIEAWVPQTDKGALRETVNRVMATRGGGCGVSHVGRGIAEVPTYGSADEALGAAARSAIAAAAQQSPFLAPGRFDTAHLVVCVVEHGNAFGPSARTAVSRALDELTAAEQFIAITDPDKRGSTEVEVTLLTVTDPATAAAAAPESENVAVVPEEGQKKANAMLFVPGYDKESAPPEKTKRKTTKLSRDDLKKYGDDSEATDIRENQPAVVVTASTVEESVTASTVEESVTAPTVEESVTASTVEESVTASTVEESVTASTVEESVTAPTVEESVTASTVEESVTASTVEESVTFTSEDLAAPASAPATMPAAEEAPARSTTRFSLPHDFGTKQVAVRISEPQEDASGNVIGYKTLDGKEIDKQSSPIKTLFGYRPSKSKEQEKSNLSKRAMGMLEKDRVGSGAIVRMEFANMSVYEGEWVNGKREGDGRQVFADGDWYEGKWYADLPDGKGRLTWKRGEYAYFEGMFNAGKPDGSGKLVETSGEEIVGTWRDGALVIAE